MAKKKLNWYAPHGLPQLIGFNFWFALGFLMLFLAGKEKRKLVRQKEQQEFDEFLVEK